jgi:uncharacterized cupin superfamily protein
VIAHIADLPRIVDEPTDPDWYPIQHYFGLTAFGVNAYVAREAGQGLIGDHDETGSDQEEVYVVTTGRARFTIDGVEHDVDAGGVVALPDPTTQRAAIALERGTTILAVGGRKRDRFDSSWQRHHFDGVPQAREERPPSSSLD